MDFQRTWQRLALLLLFISYTAQRTQIITYSPINTNQFKTTGNVNTQNINFEKLHTPFNLPVSGRPNVMIIKSVNESVFIRNALTLDLANEDPKRFNPNSKSYWQIILKRGYLFNIIGLMCLITVFGMFFLRMAFGDCGGYKWKTRKSVKKDRYFLHAINMIGFFVFLLGFGYTAYYMTVERDMVTHMSNDLIERNLRQVSKAENLHNFIDEINKSKHNVMYSAMSFEKFTIGNYIKDLTKAYEKSKNSAENLIKNFFETSSIFINTRTLFILLIIFFSVFAFIYTYKKRKKGSSLALSVVLTFTLVLCFNSIAAIFNIWSVYVDICDESIRVFSHGRPDLRYNPNNPFDGMITCLNSKEKQLLANQRTSLLIGQNAIILMLKNYFDIEDKGIVMEGLMDNVDSIDRYFVRLVKSLKVTTERNGQSYVKLRNYLMLIKDINMNLREIEELSDCLELKEFLVNFNTHMCTSGMDAHYNIMCGYFTMAFGIAMLLGCFYLTENVIHSLFNEEFQYVKTNKLRYDWN